MSSNTVVSRWLLSRSSTDSRLSTFFFLFTCKFAQNKISVSRKCAIQANQNVVFLQFMKLLVVHSDRAGTGKLGNSSDRT